MLAGAKDRPLRHRNSGAPPPKAGQPALHFRQLMAGDPGETLCTRWGQPTYAGRADHLRKSAGDRKAGPRYGRSPAFPQGVIPPERLPSEHRRSRVTLRAARPLVHRHGVTRPTTAQAAAMKCVRMS